MSKNLALHATDCRIGSNLLSSQFDHKPIVLDFAGKNVNNRRPCIANFIINDPVTELVVKTATIECYVHHSVDLVNKNEILHTLGGVRLLIRQASLESYMSQVPEPAFSRDAILAEAVLMLDELPNDITLGELDIRHRDQRPGGGQHVKASEDNGGERRSLV